MSEYKKLIRLIDLVDLRPECRPADIDDLCDLAQNNHAPVASVCVGTPFIAQAKQRLSESGIKVAGALNFPDGGEDTLAVEAEADAALHEGAQEFELVMVHRALANYRPGFAETQIVRIKRIVGERPLKVVLETGALKEPDLIAKAARVALDAGADFLKTSTGTLRDNGGQAADDVVLSEIKAKGSIAGFVASGDVRTAQEAEARYQLALQYFGAHGASSAKFRLSSDGLLAALIAADEG